MAQDSRDAAEAGHGGLATPSTCQDHGRQRLRTTEDLTPLNNAMSRWILMQRPDPMIASKPGAEDVPGHALLGPCG